VRLEIACRDFCFAVQKWLRGKSMATVSINMDLDVWHYLTSCKGQASEHKGYTLYEKGDFDRFTSLPNDCFFILNEHGEGTTIDFPIKAKPIISWSPSRYHEHNNKLQRAPRMPIERVSFYFLRKACSL
jgi:hypothetical protein